jgi:hypothetical protein
MFDVFTSRTILLFTGDWIRRGRKQANKLSGEVSVYKLGKETQIVYFYGLDIAGTQT